MVFEETPGSCLALSFAQAPNLRTVVVEDRLRGQDEKVERMIRCSTASARPDGFEKRLTVASPRHEWLVGESTVKVAIFCCAIQDDGTRKTR